MDLWSRSQKSDVDLWSRSQKSYVGLSGHPGQVFGLNEKKQYTEVGGGPAIYVLPTRANKNINCHGNQFCRSCLTQSACPFLAAVLSGVHPSSSGWLTSIPAPAEF